MKITAIIAMTIAAGPAFAAGQMTPVVICSAAEPGPVFGAAHVQTSEMFARIGIKLEWRSMSHCPAGALRMSLSTATPEDLKPGALAYALPYEGTHIVVFWDRLQTTIDPRRLPMLTAHVMAHEIAHILQGLSRHSESGVMKAFWTVADYREMACHPLSFTPEDIDLIYQGLAHRDQIVTNASAASVTNEQSPRP